MLTDPRPLRRSLPPVRCSNLTERPNQEIAPQHLGQAIGPNVLATLAKRTGLPR